MFLASRFNCAVGFMANEDLYIIEGLRERTKYIDIFLFSAHHPIVFCFRCSVYWWKVEYQILVF